MLNINLFIFTSIIFRSQKTANTQDSINPPLSVCLNNAKSKFSLCLSSRSRTAVSYAITRELSRDAPMHASSLLPRISPDSSLLSSSFNLNIEPRLLNHLNYQAIQISSFEHSNLNIPAIILTNIGLVRVVQQHREFMVCFKCKFNLSFDSCNQFQAMHTQTDIILSILSGHLNDCSQRNAFTSLLESIFGNYFSYSVMHQYF